MREDERAQAIDELIREAEGRPIVRLTNWLLHRAGEERASDIHIEPQDKHLLVRFRVDGLLHEIQKLPKWTQGAVVSRIKVLANLDIAEKRQPQDGRLMVEIRGRRVDMRVSTLPTTHGEKVVMRIIDQQRLRMDLAEIGFHSDDLEQVEALPRPAAGHPAGHRSDRLGQEHAALRGAAARAARDQEHRHGRGSGGIPDRRHQSGAGRREGARRPSPTPCAPSCARIRTSS